MTGQQKAEAKTIITILVVIAFLLFTAWLTSKQ